jgi:hypothetical protein
MVNVFKRTQLCIWPAGHCCQLRESGRGLVAARRSPSLKSTGGQVTGQSVELFAAQANEQARAQAAALTREVQESVRSPSRAAIPALFRKCIADSNNFSRERTYHNPH